MKKIVIVDGGPRKNMNTAKLLQRFAEGAKSVGATLIGRRICNEPTMQVAEWRNNIDTTPLITHRYKLADIAEAYHLFENKLDGVIKVAVAP